MTQEQAKKIERAEGLEIAEKLFSAITIGSLVLAPETEANGAGFWEALVLEQKSTDLFVLRWRDFPEQGIFQRTRNELGILNPKHATAGPGVAK